MRPRRAFVLTVIALAACGRREPPTVGRDVPFDTVCDKANDGQRVAARGYLRLPGRFQAKDRSVLLRLHEREQLKPPPIAVEIRFGEGPNQARKPTGSYTDADLKVGLADGQVAGFGERVKVSGEVYFPMVKQDFACGLTHPLIERDAARP